jgi:hypothetical protein
MGYSLSSSVSPAKVAAPAFLLSNCRRHGTQPPLLGVNDFVAAFPERLSDAIADMSERVFKFRIRPSQVREALARAIFERPTDHRTQLDIILTVLIGVSCATILEGR